jgi:hypothetical protein
MKKLPAISKLKKEIETFEINKSVAFLRSKQPHIERFRDIEDLVYEIDLENPPAALRGLDYHFKKVRTALAKALWSRGLFIGLSVLDDLLFSSIRTAAVSDPISKCLTVIKDNDVHKPGFVLYPIHSLGVNGVGFFEFFTKSRVQLAIASAGILLRAQTNSLDRSAEFLESARNAFSISKKVSRDSIDHYHQSRATKWLTHNPLLAVRVRMFSGTYYENQQFLVIKLKTVTSLLFMMAALQRGYSPKKQDVWGSTRRVNNYQTLDIHHYFVFERPLKGGTLNTKCVPMSVQPGELSDLSALPIDLAPGLWSKRVHVIDELARWLSRIEASYMDFHVLGNGKGGPAIAFSKIFTSLIYFRRSFKPRGDVNEQIVNLAVAFEVLLTAEYAKGVGKRLERRIKFSLRGTKGSRRLQAATKNLYKARSEVVHRGDTSTGYDLHSGQEAFVYVFLGVIRKVDTVPATTKDPIGAILGD